MTFKVIFTQQVIVSNYYILVRINNMYMYKELLPQPDVFVLHYFFSPIFLTLNFYIVCNQCTLDVAV